MSPFFPRILILSLLLLTFLSSPTLSQDLIIPWQDAHKYYGKEVTVEGKIVLTKNTGRVCFLNFHPNWRKYFTAVIFKSDFPKFPPEPENYYLNKTVRVKGMVKEYRGKPEIILNSPGQIVIVK